MRFKLILCGALLPPALLLAGCGMSTVSSLSPDMASPALSGRSFGGQQPITGATVYVIAVGTSGYGSQGTILATTTTDANGDFNFAAGAYTCPQSDTPVYVMGVGGNPGLSAGTYNNAAVTAAGLGSCTNAQSSGVVMNEVTTTALAFSLAHFFTTTIGGTNPFQADGDWFGGPSVTSGSTIQYSKGLVLGNSYTIPALVSNATGLPNGSSSNVTVETAKIYTIANILGACINSTGSTHSGQPCQQLFKYTNSASGVTPTDTLQAAVEIALNPSQNATNGNLFAIGSSTPAFGGGLTATPNDWTIGVSYTSSAFGLGVDTGTASTLDIDASGNVWFPSTLTGSAGAGYFDQTSRTFNGPYNTATPLVHPEQVAVDQDGYVWYNDTESSSVASFLDSSPSLTQSFSLAGTVSNGLTIGDDNKVNVGVTDVTTYELANISAARSSYTAQTGTTLSYPIISLAADTSGGDGVATTNYLDDTLTDYYVSGSTVVSDITSKKDESGQVIYTGNDFIGTRPYSGSGNSKNDGLCIYSLGACFNIKGGNQNAPVDIAIDGGSNLWLPETGDAGVLQVTPTGTSGKPDGGIYTNTGKSVPNNEFLHGTGNGGTLTTPFGVAIDNAGNVWISNANCIGTFCASTGGFTLTEIVGAGTPTITPVSAQIAGGTNLVGTEPTN